MINAVTIPSTQQGTAKCSSTTNHSTTKQHLNDAVLKKYRDYFRGFDKDGNGRLDRAEFMKMVENCGVDLDLEEMKRAYNKADSDNHGVITFRKFLQAYITNTPTARTSNMNRSSLRRRSSAPNIAESKDHLLKIVDRNDKVSPLLTTTNDHGDESRGLASSIRQDVCSGASFPQHAVKKTVSKQASDDSLLRKRRGYSEVISQSADAKQLAKYMSELQTGNVVSTQAQVYGSHQSVGEQLKMDNIDSTNEPQQISKHVQGHRNLLRTRTATLTSIPSSHGETFEPRYPASKESLKRSKKRVITRSSTIAAIPTVQQEKKQQQISSEEILIEFHKYLRENDKLVNGKLNWNHFLKLINDLGIKLTAKQMAEVYQTLNDNVDGGITYKTFLDTYTDEPNTLKPSAAESQKRVRNNTVRRRSLSAAELTLNHKPLLKTNRERAISGGVPPVAPTRDSVRSWLTRHQGKSSEILKNLTDNELKECFRCFWKSDNDSDGKLSAYEFSKMLERLGMKLTNRDLHKAFAAVDTDADGRITFNDFLCAYLSKTILQVFTPGSMKEKYCSVSATTGGYVLTGIECLKLLSQLGNELDERKLGKVLRLMKVDSQGFVTLTNFYQFLGYTPE